LIDFSKPDRLDTGKDREISLVLGDKLQKAMGQHGRYNIGVVDAFPSQSTASYQ
jgi:hypothetical protein